MFLNLGCKNRNILQTDQYFFNFYFLMMISRLITGFNVSGLFSLSSLLIGVCLNVITYGVLILACHFFKIIIQVKL